MKAPEIREMTLDDLQLKLKEMSRELFNARFQHVAGQIDNPMRIPQMKKDIARLKTVIREKGMNKKRV